jgi:hypothetical protein
VATPASITVISLGIAKRISFRATAMPMAPSSSWRICISGGLVLNLKEHLPSGQGVSGFSREAGEAGSTPRFWVGEFEVLFACLAQRAHDRARQCTAVHGSARQCTAVHGWVRLVLAQTQARFVAFAFCIRES